MVALASIAKAMPLAFSFPFFLLEVERILPLQLSKQHDRKWGYPRPLRFRAARRLPYGDRVFLGLVEKLDRGRGQGLQLRFSPFPLFLFLFWTQNHVI